MHACAPCVVISVYILRTEYRRPSVDPELNPLLGRVRKSLRVRSGVGPEMEILYAYTEY